jgi:hypothetical protein
VASDPEGPRHGPAPIPYPLSLVLLTGALAVGAVLAGCVPAQQNVAACPVAPVPQHEDIPRPPVSENIQIWQPGRWDWNSATYVWIPCVWNPAHWL